jgi:hypothetical protein
MPGLHEKSIIYLLKSEKEEEEDYDFMEKRKQMLLYT